MAGIGFELRKLTHRDDLLGIVIGYGHSAFTATGPWLFTILSLGGIVFLGPSTVPVEALSGFRTIVIYNFAFSLVLTGPFVLVMTRWLADGIYKRDVRAAPSMLLDAMAYSSVVQAIGVLPFYLWYVRMEPAMQLLAVSNYFLVSWIWLVSVFLSALKDYRHITRAFAIGMSIGLVSGLALAQAYAATGMLLGFTLGLTYIFYSLVARTLAEYPYPAVKAFRFRPLFARYRLLALSGLVYNAGIWVDKWVMWFAPEREVFASRMVVYSDYDTAMFMAYLTLVPSLAAFLMTVETQFFEQYLRYYRDIQEHVAFDRIERNRQSMLGSILDGGRTLIVIQGTITVVVILTAPYIIDAAGMNFQQVGIFRIGVLAAFFHLLFLGISVVMAYLDMRRQTLQLQTIFMLVNLGVTIVTLRLGFPYYGYGYFAASVAAFAFGFVVVARHLNQLTFHTFVSANDSVY